VDEHSTVPSRKSKQQDFFASHFMTSSNSGGRSRSVRGFRPHWALQFALGVAERDAETGQPTKAVCLLCRAFERDETQGAKRRKRLTKVHCFVAPWRPDNMRRHLEQQHARRWAQYKELSDAAKRRFFPPNVAVSTEPRGAEDASIMDVFNTEQPVPTAPELNSTVVDAVKRPGAFLVDGDVVELLHGVEDDDVEFIGFEMQEIEADEDENEAGYVAAVDSELEMDTCVKFVAAGVSFKQAAELYQGMMGGIPALGHASGASTPVTEKKVMNLCRVVCALNLQRLKDVLKSGQVWAFALSLEYGKRAGSPFLDVRVRFELRGEICSEHLVGIVVEDGELSDASRELLVRYLDVVAPDWKIQLLGVSCSNEGGIKVRECTQGVISRLATECEAPIFGDYSLAGKLTQLMSEACRTVLTVDFTNTLTNLVGRLRRERPQAPEAVRCPKLVESSWQSAVKALHWLVANQSYAIAFTERFQYVGAPGPGWWVIALAVTNVAGRVSGILRQMRGGKGLAHDRQHLIDLMNHLSMMTGAVGPFLASEFFSISCEDIVIGSFSLNPVATATFLKAQGHFASNAVDSLQPDAYQALVDVASTFVLTVLTTLNQILIESNNEVGESSNSDDQSRDFIVDQVPACLPSVLCNIRHQDFVGVMQQQRVRLEKRFSSEEMEQIEAQHYALRNGYLLEKHIREEVDQLPDSGSFAQGWQEGIVAGLECRALRSFCGAFAAVASETMESEFALINWRKVPFSQSITDFSLEAILHAQDYRAFRSANARY
jgi:hypothetical protein